MFFVFNLFQSYFLFYGESKTDKFKLTENSMPQTNSGDFLKEETPGSKIYKCQFQYKAMILLN